MRELVSCPKSHSVASVLQRQFLLGMLFRNHPHDFRLKVQLVQDLSSDVYRHF